MTKRQKLELRRIAVVSRLNEIGEIEGESYNEEVRNEEAGLKTELRQTDSRIETALLTEGAEEAEARGALSGLATVSLPRSGSCSTARPSPTISGRPVPAARSRAGRPNSTRRSSSRSRASAAAWPSTRPWEVLEVRAFTTTAENDGSQMQRPILQRLFGPGVMDALGVRMDSVPAGRAEWPLISGGVAPAQAKEGTAAAAAVAATFTTATSQAEEAHGHL